MKGLDVFIVRFTPFVLFLIFGINAWCCFHGYEEITLTYELHGNSALYALALYLISLSNKKYHCRWNRAMYLYLIIVPIFNFLDATFYLFEEWDNYVAVIHCSYGAVAIYTAFMAIRHFIQMSKRRLDNGNE